MARDILVHLVPPAPKRYMIPSSPFGLGKQCVLPLGVLLWPIYQVTQKAASLVDLRGKKKEALPQVQAEAQASISHRCYDLTRPMVLHVPVEETGAAGVFGSPLYMNCSAGPQDFGAKSYILYR